VAVNRLRLFMCVKKLLKVGCSGFRRVAVVILQCRMRQENIDMMGGSSALPHKGAL
jgi:hypothetical protein